MNNLIAFPDGFVATKYPGYFWNYNEECLYSIKVSGVLRKLELLDSEFYRRKTGVKGGGYYISHRGKRQFIRTATLKQHATTTVLNNQTHRIPVAN